MCIVPSAPGAPGGLENNVSTNPYPKCFDAYVDRVIDRLNSKRVEVQAKIELLKDR
jgi:hypothetical protein